MSLFFKKIALAIAFSPRLEALLFETARLQHIWRAELVLIHVGNASSKDSDTLNDLLQKAGIQTETVIVKWVFGDPADQILSVCKSEKVDLLIAGAMKKENIIKYYLGTVARKILRKAPCSVLLLLNPSIDPKPFRNIVVNAEDSPYVEQALILACSLAKSERANWLHIVREVKLYGLTMSAAEQSTEEEYNKLRNELVSNEIDNVQRMLNKIPHEGVKVNIKALSGKSGFELSQFTTRKQADLLITGAPTRRFYFFDRVFTHDQEYLFADLPCNLLVVHRERGASRKEAISA
jgi:nucleotide-binding universal stress UspA family protein